MRAALACCALIALALPAAGGPGAAAAAKKALPCVVVLKTERGRGAAVVLGPPGRLVTCRHVLGGATKAAVVLDGGRELSAEVVAVSEADDLVLLRADPERLPPPLALAPAAPEVGAEVLAIGHPHGYDRTVTRGIVGAVGREITMPTGHTLTGLVQTDAAVNPGSSGGPLVNEGGEVVGIVVAYRDGARGLAFAVGAPAVRRLLDSERKKP